MGFILSCPSLCHDVPSLFYSKSALTTPSGYDEMMTTLFLIHRHMGLMISHPFRQAPGGTKGTEEQAKDAIGKCWADDMVCHSESTDPGLRSQSEG